MRYKFLLMIFAICMVVLSVRATIHEELRYDFENGMPSEIVLHDADGNTPSSDNSKYGFTVGTPWVVFQETSPSLRFTQGKLSSGQAQYNHVVVSTSWYSPSGTSNDWMVLPALSVADNGMLLSWKAMATHKKYRDGYSIYISTEGTDIEDFDLNQPFFSVEAEENQWQRHSMSLDAYKGQTIYIAFVNNSTNCDNLFIDDIFAGVSSAINMQPKIPAVVSPYQKLTFGGKVFTDSNDTIKGYKVELEIEGMTFTYDQPDAVIRPGEMDEFSFPTDYSLQMGVTVDYTLTLTHADVTITRRGSISSHQRRCVAEELTGMWCGYCVRGIVAFEQAEEAFGDSFIGVAVHGGDYIENADYVDYIAEVGGFTGYPSCLTNRIKDGASDPLMMPSSVQKYLYEDMKGCVDLKVEKDELSGLYTAITSSRFAYDMTDADYSIFYVVKENDVYDENDPDASKHYYQHNVYGLGNDGEMYGYENLPEYLRNYHFQDVARGKICEWEGIEGSLPSDILAGEAYSHTLEFTLPEEVLKAWNCQLVAMLINGKTGEVINAAEAALPDAEADIENLPYNNKQQDGCCYTLAGQRIMPRQGATNNHGIIILNGKKIIH